MKSMMLVMFLMQKINQSKNLKSFLLTNHPEKTINNNPMNMLDVTISLRNNIPQRDPKHGIK